MKYTTNWFYLGSVSLCLFFWATPVCASCLHHSKPAHPFHKQQLITRQCGLRTKSLIIL